MLRPRERRLLKQIQAGQREACEQLVRTHYRPVYAFLYRMTGDIDRAEDLTQETFASAWASIANFEGRASFGTWLHRIAYNKFVDSQRALQRENVMLQTAGRELSTPCTDPSPLAHLMAEERSRRLQEAVFSLDDRDRAVIVLHYHQGLSFRQMAQVLDEPIGTVKWRTSQALRRLRTSLNGRTMQ